LHGNGEVPRGDAVGLEEGDFSVATAAAGLAGDDIGETFDAGPAGFVAVEGEDKVAGFLAGLLDGVHDDDVGASDGFVIKFALVGVIGANGVDVQAVGEVGVVHHRMRGSGRGANDVGLASGLGGGCSRAHRDAHTLGHFPSENLAFLRVAAVNV